MKTLWKRISLLIFISIPFITAAQSPKIHTAPKKKWITDVDFGKEAKPIQGQESSYYYLLIDEQQNVSTQESYVHYAYKILTNEGVQEMSDLSFEFDPEYQDLIFHYVIVHRGENKIQQLTKNVRTIQREQSMDRYLYDGSLTAIINLTDIRVGDIIEYAFTLKGYNPVYKGHVAKKLYFDYNVAFDKGFQRLLIPSALAVNIKHLNTTHQPVIKREGQLTDYTWTFSKMSGIISDNNTPEWYDPNQHVMITDFKNWEEVAQWALPEYSLSEAEKEIIKKKIASSFDGSTDEAFALQAIRFVQDEIRYLGFESGLNSHKPHSPTKVYAQRFGDCKDKSYLLTSILQARGIEAHPVLVSTDWRDKLEEQLPSYNAFNHCVVQLKIKDQTYYIDPTISNQGGTLDKIYFPTYGKGLVIKEATTDLVEFPVAETSSISEIQTFDIASIGGEAMLTVRTSYTGNEADYQRSHFSKNNLETIQKNYLTFYGNLYPEITKFENIVTNDNRNNNVFIVEEKYKIPTFWKPHETKEGVIYCEAYAQSLENYFDVSKSASRTAPYRLSYPVDYHHHIHLKLPEEWNAEPDDQIIENEFYQYEYQVSYANKEISLYRHYKTKQNHVPVKAFDKFVEDHQKMMGNQNYSLTYNKNVAEASSTSNVNWAGIVTTIVALVIGVWLVWWLYNFYDPKPDFPASEGEPIGGWLFLVAIGVTLTPLRVMYDFFKDPALLTGQSWSALLELKRYGLFSFVFLEQVYNVIYFLFSILIAVLFYQRRSAVPLLISILYGATCIVKILDTVVSAQIDPNLVNEKGYYKDMLQAIIAAVIWIPYFQMSSRVKETFVNRAPGNNDDDNLVAEPIAAEQIN